MQNTDFWSSEYGNLDFKVGMSAKWTRMNFAALRDELRWTCSSKFMLVHPNSFLFITVQVGSSQLISVHPSSFQFISVHFSSSLFILVHPSSFWFILVHFGSYWTWMNIHKLGYWTMNQGGLGWTKINKFIPIHLGSVWFISISFILIPIHLVYHGSFQGISVHFVFPSSSQPIQVNFHPLGSSQFILAHSISS